MVLSSPCCLLTGVQIAFMPIRCALNPSWYRPSGCTHACIGFERCSNLSLWGKGRFFSSMLMLGMPRRIFWNLLQRMRLPFIFYLPSFSWDFFFLVSKYRTWRRGRSWDLVDCHVSVSLKSTPFVGSTCRVVSGNSQGLVVLEILGVVWDGPHPTDARILVLKVFRRMTLGKIEGSMIFFDGLAAAWRATTSVRSHWDIFAEPRSAHEHYWLPWRKICYAGFLKVLTVVIYGIYIERTLKNLRRGSAPRTPAQSF